MLAVRVLQALVTVALAVLYTPTAMEMVRLWRTDQYAGHGPFVPLFTILLLWSGRDEIRATPRRPDVLGLGVVGLGVVLLGAGQVLDSVLVKGLSIVVSVAGLVLWAFGRQVLRRLAFPIGFLLYMVPLPYALVASVTGSLQRFAAGFSAGTLRLVGVPVHQSGPLLELPPMTLEVAEICNGLRFLIALLVLTTAFAYIMLDSPLRRLALVLSAIPIAVFANAVRVATISVGVVYVGPEAASGTIHHVIGKVVWALTIIPLAAVAFALRRWPQTPAPRHAPLVGTEGYRVSDVT